MTPCPSCARLGLDAHACSTRPKCVTCRGITHLPTWGCCAGCVTSVDRMLAELLDLHALANHPAALMPKAGEPGTGGARRDPPPPLDIDALDLAVGEHLLGVLESWERWWREAFTLTPYGEATEALPRPYRPGNVTLMHVVGFLRTWWPRAAQVLEPPPDEFAQEVRGLHRGAVAALRLAEPAAWSIACPTDGCGNRLRVEHDGRDAVLRCHRCHVERTVAQLLNVARSEGRPCWVDAQTAARALRVDVGHLGPMVRDGRVRVRGAREFRQFDIGALA
jgi:hypothetical protein